LGTRRRTVEIVDHDPGWAQRSRDERDRLWSALRQAGAAGEVVAIEHIGSTAVPGLAAKPVIDTMIGIRRFPAPEPFVRALGTLGYVHHGESGLAGRQYFTDAPLGRPRTRHVHTVEHDSWFWREHLRFRDHLRAHPGEATAYAALKRDLARLHPHDLNTYSEGKTAFVRDALARARAGAGAGRIHRAAESGFGAAAGEYQGARPSYPGEAIAYLVDQLGLGPGLRLVDIGAGTGKLTALLGPSGASVVAVEPVEAMRAALRSGLPGVDVEDGTAEELPVPTASAGAVVAGQAFHWFDAWMALSEIHRVLADGGRVGLVWNVRDESVDWMARWTQMLEPFVAGSPRERQGRWRDAVVRTALFTDLEMRAFENPHAVARETVVGRMASISFVSALDDERRAALLDDFRGLLATHPQTRDRDEIVVPYRTEVHTFRRVP
jgi:GrpB-like predicted nucleotidyltransferase (UPF0157 family)/SAM-dependent methyltransferase